jgi:D-glutamate cyclase
LNTPHPSPPPQGGREKGAGCEERIDRIEGLIQEEVGRNIGLLTAAARGGLFSAATAIARAPAPRLGVITGFYVPRGTPPAAETDGPVGVALLLHGLTRVGIHCRVATDEPCRATCAAALRAAGLGEIPLDVVPLASPLDRVIAAWREAGITHALSVERCGRASDKKPHNLTGLDVGDYTAPLDDLFLAGPLETLAIGDGGNEIGMGSLPPALIAQSVANGEKIACVTPARHLIVAGVSNWGAWGLLAALAVLRPEWRTTLLASLDENLDRTILETTVREGPAVDGVSREQTLTVDRLGIDVHHAKLRAIRALV